MKLYYLIRLVMLCAPFAWGALAGIFIFLGVGTVVFFKSLWYQAEALSNGLYLKITNGRILSEGMSGFVLVLCWIVVGLWLLAVWIILSHITVAIFQSISYR